MYRVRVNSEDFGEASLSLYLYSHSELHPDSGADTGFLEREFISINGWGSIC